MRWIKKKVEINAFEVLHNDLRKNNAKSQNFHVYSLGWSTNQLTDKLVYRDIVFPGFFPLHAQIATDNHRKIALYTGKCFQWIPVRIRTPSLAKIYPASSVPWIIKICTFPVDLLILTRKEVYLDHYNLQTRFFRLCSDHTLSIAHRDSIFWMFVLFPS